MVSDKKVVGKIKLCKYCLGCMCEKERSSCRYFVIADEKMKKKYNKEVIETYGRN